MIQDERDVTRAYDEVMPGETMEVLPAVAPAPPQVQRVTITSDTVAIGRVTVEGLAFPVPVMVVPYHRDRLRITIKNMNIVAGNAVYVGSAPSVTTESGIRLDALDTMTLETRAALWAICASAESAIVGFISELRQHDE